jgi:hypothetical protein
MDELAATSKEIGSRRRFPPFCGEILRDWSQWVATGCARCGVGAGHTRRTLAAPAVLWMRSRRTGSPSRSARGRPRQSSQTADSRCPTVITAISSPINGVRVQTEQRVNSSMGSGSAQTCALLPRVEARTALRAIPAGTTT